MRSGGRPYPPVPGTCNESGWEKEEDVFTAAALLSCGVRWWGDCVDDNSKEDKVEEDDNGVTIAATAGEMADLRSPQGEQ